jgi:hypothetical protein
MDITQIVSNLGFPIAITLYLLYYVKELNNQHREEVNELRTAIENNTLIVTKLCDKLDIDVQKNGE